MSPVEDNLLVRLDERVRQLTDAHAAHAEHTRGQLATLEQSVFELQRELAVTKASGRSWLAGAVFAAGLGGAGIASAFKAIFGPGAPQ